MGWRLLCFGCLFCFFLFFFLPLNPPSACFLTQLGGPAVRSDPHISLSSSSLLFPLSLLSGGRGGTGSDAVRGLRWSRRYGRRLLLPVAWQLLLLLEKNCSRAMLFPFHLHSFEVVELIPSFGQPSEEKVVPLDPARRAGRMAQLG